jgi:ribonuclease HIII
MEKKMSYTLKLTPEQMEQTARLLREGNYRPRKLEHTLAAASAADCQIAVYNSGKCLVQGKGAADWISFVLEPQILGEARLGYEEALNPESVSPHMGVDESGKGDFFGPLVIAAAYVDETIARDLKAMNVRDSKTITTDKAMQDLARKIRGRLGDRTAVVAIGPAAYNRLYEKMGSVNRILAWGHAKAIENLLEKVPNCPRALSDQFGPEQQIKRALQQKGRQIKLEQRHKAESDVAVAAASILARAGFLDAMRKLGETHGATLPKGASDKVKAVAAELAGRHGGAVFLETAKCHFKTTDDVLASIGKTRAGEGLPPAPDKKPFVPRKSAT